MQKSPLLCPVLGLRPEVGGGWCTLGSSHLCSAILETEPSGEAGSQRDEGRTEGSSAAPTSSPRAACTFASLLSEGLRGRVVDRRDEEKKHKQFLGQGNYSE